MKWKTVGIFIITLLIATIIIPIVSSDNPLQSDHQDVGHNEGDKYWWTSVYSDIAQSFKPSHTMRYTRVRLPLRNQGVLGDVTVYIRKDLSGNNLATATFPASRITDEVPAVHYDFDFPDMLVFGGMTYYIVLHVGGTKDEQVIGWRYADEDVYPDGCLWSEGFSDWIGHGDCDFGFGAWGENKIVTPIIKERFNTPFIRFIENNCHWYPIISRLIERIYSYI